MTLSFVYQLLQARSIIDKMDHDKDGKVSIQNVYSSFLFLIEQLEYILNKSYTKDEPLPTMEEIQEEENHKQFISFAKHTVLL